MGAGKWLHLKKYNNTGNTNSQEAIQKLKQENYRIVATVPGENCISLDAFDVSKGKAAFVFGSEINGISPVMRENADELLTIPMFGFTESFNISVSAAIILFTLLEKVKRNKINWQLSPDEKNSLLLEWLKLSIKRPELLIQNFYNTANS
jgi:tRNA (guanosine-2'-O-)-methyltransferase